VDNGAILTSFSEIFDISVTLGLEAPVYPGDPAYSREKVYSLDAGDTAEVSKLTLCAHSGTHIDLPTHFFRNSPGVSELPPERFILPARVVEIESPLAVSLEELKRLGLNSGRAVLFKTANSGKGLVRSGRFSEKYVYIKRKAAEHLAALNAPLVGLDYYSIDRFDSSDYPAHRALLSAGTVILEGIDLAAPPAGEYTLICLPLKLPGVEASPVRAVLLR
jgi:arylformamidase